MDKAKILELAREAFCDSVLVDIQAQASAELLAFARLVAEAEREACLAAAHKVARKHHKSMTAGSADGHIRWLGANEVCNAIRSRTE